MSGLLYCSFLQLFNCFLCGQPYKLFAYQLPTSLPRRRQRRSTCEATIWGGGNEDNRRGEQLTCRKVYFFMVLVPACVLLLSSHTFPRFCHLWLCLLCGHLFYFLNYSSRMGRSTGDFWWVQKIQWIFRFLKFCELLATDKSQRCPTFIFEVLAEKVDRQNAWIKSEMFLIYFASAFWFVGSSIRFIALPDLLKSAPVFQKVTTMKRKMEESRAQRQQSELVCLFVSWASLLKRYVHI